MMLQPYGRERPRSCAYHDAIADEDLAVVTARLEKANDADVPSRASLFGWAIPRGAAYFCATEKLREQK